MTKRCPRCKIIKHASYFAKNSKRPDGLQSWCRKCNTESRTEWARANKDKIRTHSLWSRYRLTQVDYDAMLVGQQNKCAVCREEFTKTPHVDHDHKTLKVRGLLCSRCNTFVGYVETNNLMDNAIEYLENALLV